MGWFGFLFLWVFLWCFVFFLVSFAREKLHKWNILNWLYGKYRHLQIMKQPSPPLPKSSNYWSCSYKTLQLFLSAFWLSGVRLDCSWQWLLILTFWIPSNLQGSCSRNIMCMKWQRQKQLLTDVFSLNFLTSLSDSWPNSAQTDEWWFTWSTSAQGMFLSLSRKMLLCLWFDGQ